MKKRRSDPARDQRWTAALASAKEALAREDFTAAGDHLQAALQITPRNPDLLANLGGVRARQQRLDEAVTALEAALAIDAGHAVARRNLVITLGARGNQRLGRRELAAGIADLRRALAVDPTAAAIESALGLGLAESGELPAAIAHYQRALARIPDDAATLNRLGKALMDLGRFDEARTAFAAALAAKPDLLEATVNLGAVLFELGLLADAEGCGRRAVALAPGSPEAHNNLALALREQGDVAGAREEFEVASALAPTSFLWQSGRLLTLNYLETIDEAALQLAHRQVGEAWTASVGGARKLAPRDPDPARPLRVGYVSPDLRTHSVAYFVEAFLGHHDPAAVEVTCYHDGPRSDAVTERLRALAPRWRPSHALSDERFLALIDEDRIDVLVDLAGHTARNRLAAFARRAAPLQMTYLGYGVTTGLPAMDYLLTDALADPTGGGSEALLHLDGGYAAYRPPLGPDGGPPLASRADGPITFGSFNNLAKIGDGAVAAWAAILRAVPDARLLLKARGLAGAGAGARLLDRFAAHGVQRDRITLSPPTATTVEHLAHYGQVDIALDTCPYNGTTTTCEALWMGVPVITVAGDRHMGRIGRSLLARVGLDELCGRDAADYVRIAVALAQDRPRLQALRGELRPRLLASPLMDGRRLARALEGAYRQAWAQLLTSS